MSKDLLSAAVVIGALRVNHLKTKNPPKQVLWLRVQTQMKYHNYAAVHQGLQCSLRQNQSSEKEIYNIFLESITCDPFIYTMDHLDLTVSNFIRKFHWSEKC